MALLLALTDVSRLALANPSAASGLLFDGRWATTDKGRMAEYGGSAVIMHFAHSSAVSADINVPRGTVYVSVSVDQVALRRIEIDRGVHPHFAIASGLAMGGHVVVLTVETEPGEGTILFANPRIGPSGSWLGVTDHRPVVEVLGDSDSTGICVLGPTSRKTSSEVGNPAWHAETLAWPAQFARLSERVLGRPIDVVDLAIAGTRTVDEATSYPQILPVSGGQVFKAYSEGRTVQLALLFGGVNDHGNGGEPARATPVAYGNLSPFQRGVYDQMAEILSYNPNVQFGLLWYVDPYVPSWKLAYRQVLSLFPQRVRLRAHVIGLVDRQLWNACDINPDGHPDLGLHKLWAAELLNALIVAGVRF